MRHCLYLNVISLALVGCGHIPPSAHKEVNQDVLTYLGRGDSSINGNRLYLCQGRSLTKLPDKDVSDSWVQPRNTQISIYDASEKIAVINDDEVAVMDFSKSKNLNFEWRFEISNAIITSGDIKLDPTNSAYSKGIKSAHQKIDRLFTVTDTGFALVLNPGVVTPIGGQAQYSYPITISGEEKFCSNKRIVFYKKFN